MKKLIFAMIACTLLFVLAACGNTSGTENSQDSTSLSLEGQLLVGTFKLEGTTLAVTADQAGQLLPLWETLQSMAGSGTAASEEVDAVVAQIKNTLSAQQVAGIAAMKLTQLDLAAAMNENGATIAASSTSGTSTSQLPAGSGAGGPGEGNPPADLGGGIPASTGAGSAGLTQVVPTQAVTGGAAGTSDQISPALINSLVEMLKKKAG